MQKQIQQTYIEECKKANSSIEKIEDNAHNNYIREIIDTICTAQTYIEQTNILMDMLKEYIDRDDKNNADYQRIEQALQKLKLWEQ